MLTPTDTVKIFQRHCESTTVPAGQTIFSTGETGTVMYGIVEGEVNFLVNGEVFETLEAGDAFGEGALVQPDRSRASTAVAKTDCTLAELDRDRFLFAVQETPEFALQIIRSYSNRLRRLKRAAT